MKNLTCQYGMKNYKDLNAVIMEYIGQCTARGAASEKTKIAYLAAIKIFLSWCNSIDVLPANINVKDVERWRHVLKTAGLSSGTIMLRLAAVRTLFKAMIRAGLRTDNPAVDVKSPKPEKKPIDLIMAKIIFPEQMILVLGKLAEDQRGVRDRVILLVMYLLGLRVSEVAGLDWQDFNDDLLTFRSKGGQERSLSVPNALKLALNDLKTDHSSGPMFLGFKSGRLSIRGIQKMVSSRMLGAGLKIRSPHAFRHSCATVAAIAGVSPFAIQDQLGHASQKTTSIYTRVAGRFMDAPSKAVAMAVGL